MNETRMTSRSEIRVLNSAEDLFQAAAAEFITLATDAVHQRGRFCVALSGGSTPKNVYSLLADTPSLPWDKMYFFFGDERNVPPDDPDSNYRMAYEAMLFKAPKENVFRIRGEEDSSAAAIEYEQTLRTFFQLQPGTFPRFDLVLLGLGPDGHAASLFPGTCALDEKTRLVVANWVEKFKTFRITITFPVINHAAFVMFLVSGPDKSAALRQVIENESACLPAQMVQPRDGRLLWLADKTAATGFGSAP
jgi:6-phosphogluconolactonase